MGIPFVVPEILGEWNHSPDAIKLSEKADEWLMTIHEFENH